ncbi:hypothetical protein GCM10011584_12950 [Nocardioides phosphati]|uniref:HU family DNA-binding protein n=1 Tax=Nocardioides phosphati TaxID=1867775 RepID=A0ABQ2N9X9_9ACTN|nr:HU family DNA-binding protein [Nocardioides phosphati]GGO87698.1 hypothetical protein GCM10011584_12950 [Nocardioides phosphati]
MNKTQLIDALAARYEGNRKMAAAALDAVLDTITREVARGEKVAITGFGSFEKRIRPARMVRNPRTGERIKAKKTAIPKFTAGADLKAVISGAKKLPKLDLNKKAAPAKAAAAKATEPAKKAASGTSAATRKAVAPAKKAASTAATKAAPAKKAAAKASEPAKKAASKAAAPAKKAATKAAAPAKKAAGTAAKKATGAAAAAKKTTAKKAPAKKAPAKKAAPSAGS